MKNIKKRLVDEIRNQLDDQIDGVTWHKANDEIWFVIWNRLSLQLILAPHGITP